MQVELNRVDLTTLTRIFESAARDDQQNERNQQQYPASGREFLEYSPEEFPDDVNVPAVIGQSLGRFRGDIFGVEAVAGAGFGFKLGPELADLESIGDALPELLHAHSE